MAEVYGTFGQRDQKGMISLKKEKIFRTFDEHFGRGYSIYENSFKVRDETAFFLVKGEENKKLILVSREENSLKGRNRCLI